MKVLELSTARIWGGGEVHQRAVCLGLRDRGHHVLAACRPDAPLFGMLADDGLPVHQLVDDGDARPLARLAAAHGIDLIHAHQSKGARLAVSARYLAGKPRAVLTRHALGPPDRDVPLAGLNRIIAVSRAVARDCLAAGFPPGRMAVVPNGVDPERFRPGLPAASASRLGLPPGARAVVVTGRLSAEKGCAQAIGALLPLLAPAEIHLLVLGEGELRAKLERMVRRAGAEDRVRFLGHQQDVRPILALAEVVVAPGPREAFGLAILEAMAMGCAVVGIAAGGVPEVITGETNGLLVAAGDGLGLASSVYRLVTDEALRRRLGRAARERALDLTEGKMIEATEAVLAGAMAARSLSG